jgi:two-component system NtrC family sensor kinase
VLVLAVGQDYYAEYVGVELRPGEGPSGQAFQRRTVMRLDDYQTWNAQAAAYHHEPRIHSVIAAPLLGRYAPLGVLFVASDQGGQQFDDHEVRLVELITAEAAIALENAQLYEQQQEHLRYLQESQARLIQAEKMSALGRLVASIAHEINNPLQAVQGCLTLVRESVAERPRLDPDQAAGVLRDLDVAASEVTRVAGIVQRLRDFYRPTRVGAQLADINVLIETVLALTARQLQHSRIELDPALTAHPLPLMTNADQIKQVCLNLILNAIDAMPQGGRLRVATRLTGASRNATAADGLPARSMVCIDFADTGSGISLEALPQIFEPFFTTKETGSGLGLSISYEIVKALGGEITVTSELQRGSTFTIWLPVEANAAETLSEVKPDDR